MRIRTDCIWVSLALLCLTTIGSSIGKASHVPHHSTPHLTDSERASLRYRLENLYNEVDLLIQNQKVDRSDVQRQERDLSGLKVPSRVPFERDLNGLRNELTHSAQKKDIQVFEFEVKTYSSPGKKLPRTVYTDDPKFRLTTQQIIEEIHFRTVVHGSQPSVLQWVLSWRDPANRLIESDTSDPSRSIKKLKSDLWEIRGHGYRFREMSFPTLRPRDPREILPPWARRNPEAFQRSEPALWSWVTRIESLIPQTEPLYKNRGQFMLNDARLNFFLSKSAQH